MRYIQFYYRYSLLPTPYSLLPTPYSLLPTPYSLLPTPSSLLPTPYSLNCYTLYLTQLITALEVNTSNNGPAADSTDESRYANGFVYQYIYYSNFIIPCAKFIPHLMLRIRCGMNFAGQLN
ncbi:hypothetical protein [Moorena sp. SIO3A2]|uniref:hypothetical protein n=1 Tax=Moorena sp. SIO3A2 TaxID=2607841 RepID=UPI0013B8DB98|nr:hypothetical protein [Moorena sp. SIO3A2]NER87272.1 hypothetical protein [Moorena sp. SIO3A2]